MMTLAGTKQEIEDAYNIHSQLYGYRIEYNDDDEEDRLISLFIFGS